jgi:hypothetical protein
MSNGQRIGILLNTTAPAMTLMSGALRAFAEQGVELDTISTTGAGGFIGLLYLAPKERTRIEALREVPNLYVSDWMYRLCPMNFNLFHKYGPFAEQFWRFRKHLPRIPVAPDEAGELKRFVNDWIQLWATALTPTSLQSLRKGLMSHVPLVADFVDFDKLRVQPAKFYINAFSLRTCRLRVFDEREVNTDLFNAAQAMYMLFEPMRVADDLLITGATRDPTGLQAIGTHRRGLSGRPPLTHLVALDPVSDAFWRMPENAYDAFQLMLMNPIASLQERMLNLYAKIESSVNAQTPGRLTPLYKIPVGDHISEDYYPRMLDWTHANAVKLEKIGHDAAVPLAGLLKQPPSASPPGPRLRRRLGPIAGGSDDPLEEYRYARALETDQPTPRQTRVAKRAEQSLSLYGPLFANLPLFFPPAHVPPAPAPAGPEARRQPKRTSR